MAGPKLRLAARLLAWSGWIIVLAAALVLVRAPDSARVCFRWALLKTWDPAARFLSPGDWTWPHEPDFRKPERYFPVGAFGIDRDGGEFWAKTFSQALETFEEPSLFEEQAGESVRLLYVRSFHCPVSVRLCRDAGNWRLISKRLGYWDARAFLEFRRETSISSSFAESCKARLAQIGFWSTQAVADDGLDGAEWIVEARIDGNYHVVKRWSPTNGDPYRDLCVSLLKKGHVADGPLY